MSLFDEYLFVDDFCDNGLAERLLHSHTRRTRLGTTKVRVHVDEQWPFASGCRCFREKMSALTASLSAHGLAVIFIPLPEADKPEVPADRNVESGWAVTNHDVLRRIRGPSRILGNGHGRYWRSFVFSYFIKRPRPIGFAFSVRIPSSYADINYQMVSTF